MILEDTQTPSILISSINNNNITDKLTRKVGEVRVADKSLAWPGRKQATATEEFYVHISYL